MKVFIYFNLHKKVWSVKALEGDRKGLVIAHAESFVVRNAVFKVSEAGRQRVLREKRKNVHAGIVGQWDADVTPQSLDIDGLPEGVSYNPYKSGSFYNVKSQEPVSRSPLVVAQGRKVSFQPC